MAQEKKEYSGIKSVEDFVATLLEIWFRTKISRREIAQQAGITRAAVYAWITGGNVPRLDSILRVLQASGYEMILRKVEDD